MLTRLGFDEDLPESKRHLNYAHLTLQSKRIMNRLIKYLTDHKTTAEAFLKPFVIQQIVKSKVKTDKVDIIKDAHFFNKLKEAGVVKKEKPKKNLCKFLCIDENNYVNLLMLKKIIRALQDF